MTSTLEPPVRGSRLRDRAMRAAEAATSPLLPADYLDLFAPLRSGADLRGRIEEIHPETPDAATIVIRPGADWAGHVPGQYLRIGIDVDGVRQWRAYSLTHGPRRDGCISITVKAVPDGAVSNHLVHESRPGTLVHLDQAAGEFVLQSDVERLLSVTAGSGITPVIGMLRNLFPSTDAGALRLERSAGLDITVVHVASSRPDSIFICDLEALDAAAGAIRLVARYDDEDGVLDVADLPTLVPDLAERRTLACGPAGLLDALAAHHEAARSRAGRRAVPYDPGPGGRGRHHHLRRRPRDRGRRRHPHSGRRRAGRRPHAQRMPGPTVGWPRPCRPTSLSRSACSSRWRAAVARRAARPRPGSPRRPLPASRRASPSPTPRPRRPD